MADRLLDIITRLGELSDDWTIFAAEPWRPDSPAWVGDEAHQPAGLSYLLEVDLAREVVGVWSAWRDGQTPTEMDAFSAVVHYAENDAYQPVE